MNQAVFPITPQMVQFFYVRLNECLQALNMDTILQSIFRFACVASPGETTRLMATVTSLLGNQLIHLPYGKETHSWKVINVSAKFGTIVFKASEELVVSVFVVDTLTSSSSSRAEQSSNTHKAEGPHNTHFRVTVCFYRRGHRLDQPRRGARSSQRSRVHHHPARSARSLSSRVSVTRMRRCAHKQCVSSAFPQHCDSSASPARVTAAPHSTVTTTRRALCYRTTQQT